MVFREFHQNLHAYLKGHEKKSQHSQKSMRFRMQMLSFISKYTSHNSKCFVYRFHLLIADTIKVGNSSSKAEETAKGLHNTFERLSLRFAK